MASTFFGLTIGTSGLYAAQTALNVTANNIANENTDGYTRQEVTQTEKASLRTYTSSGTLGSGVEVTEITQVRDEYYDEKYWTYNTQLGESTVTENYLTQIEAYYDEVNVDGFTTEFSNLFSALEELENDPSDLTVRDEVLNYLSSLSDYVNNIYGELEDLSDEVNTEVSNAADTINSLTTQIASLTEQINTIEMSTGSTANELRDARALLVDELSGYVPIEVTETTYDTGKSDYKITSDGFTLVDTFESNDLVIQADEDGKYYTYIYYDESTGTGTLFSPDSGSLYALYEIRDGNNGVASYDITETFSASDYTSESTAVDSDGDGTTDYYTLDLGDSTLSDSFSDSVQSGLSVMNADGTTNTYYSVTTVSEEYASEYGPAADEIFYVAETGEYIIGSDIQDEIEAALTAGAVSVEITYTIEGENDDLDSIISGTTTNADLDIDKTEAVDFKGIEYYMSELDSLKTTLAQEFNETHYTGINLYGDSTQGVDILIIDESGNLSVNEDLIDDPSLMATSTQSVQDGVEDADLVEAWQEIEDGEVFDGVTCEDYLESITTEIAMDVSKVSNQLENYTNIIETITNQRLSVSGVDTDEETVNLVKYQEAYNLASKVISVMAEVLDKLIEETAV